MSLVAGAFWSLGAAAGVILSPVAVLANTAGTQAGSTDHTRDGSGLPAFLSGVTDFATYVSAAPTHAAFADANAWASLSEVYSGAIDYDLGSFYEITQVALWNQDDDIGQGVNSFDILTSDNALFIGATNVGSFNADDSSRLVQVFSLTPSLGRYVRLQINSNHGGQCCVTLGEIALDAGNAAPEPATLALLGVALAGLGFSRRRKLH